MLEGVECRPMTNHQDGGASELPHRLAEPTRDSIHRLRVAFAVAKRFDQMERSSVLDLGRWASCQFTVVAFTQPTISDYRNRAIAECNLGGAKRSPEIRAEDDGKQVAATTLAERPRLLLTSGREIDIEPAGR
jgi:hypothetical protein